MRKPAAAVRKLPETRYVTKAIRQMYLQMGQQAAIRAILMAGSVYDRDNAAKEALRAAEYLRLAGGDLVRWGVNYDKALRVPV